MSVQPIRDFITVSKEDSARTTASGLHLVTTEEKNISGTVLAVGTGRVTMNGSIVPLDVKVGDKIMFNKNLAVEVKNGNDSVWVLREDQVICVIR